MKWTGTKFWTYIDGGTGGKSNLLWCCPDLSSSATMRWISDGCEYKQSWLFHDELQ